ncbi:MAG TPA: hypothetical protein VFX90_04240 [Rhodoferax sp.]|nr:hypothetical protein [Rhodoferax sp.]
MVVIQVRADQEQRQPCARKRRADFTDAHEKLLQLAPGQNLVNIRGTIDHSFLQPL